MRLKLLAIVGSMTACAAGPVGTTVEDVATAKADADAVSLLDFGHGDGLAACPNSPNGTTVPPDVKLPLPPSPSQFYPGQTVPAPTLQVEVGYTQEATHSFLPYVERGWAPLVLGQQGGIHVPLALMVELPGVDAASVKVQIRATVTLGAAEVAIGNAATVSLVQAATEFGYKKGDVDLRVIFTNSVWNDAPLFCGQWVQLRVQVYWEPNKGAPGVWGQAVRTLQLYATNVMP